MAIVTGDVLAAVADGATGGFKEFQDGFARRRFPTAALSNQSQCLFALNTQTDSIYRVNLSHDL